MADISITIVIPDAVVSRVQEALGVTNKAEATAWIKNQIKNQVVNYEANKARELAEEAVNTAQEAQMAAEQTAHETAEAEITIGD